MATTAFLASAAVARPAPSRNERPQLVQAPGMLCDAAVRAAEYRYHLPPGLLFAISQVESGRPDPTKGQREPWPWTVQAEGHGMYFDSKAQAIQWVRDAMARGINSIDTGCLQVNLFFHPHAFANLEEAFDPDRNADYAARFLLQLHASNADWQQATGFYHSQTLTLAIGYRARIGRALNGDALAWPSAPKPPTALDRLGNAWHATFGAGQPAPATSGTHDWSVLLRAPTALPPRLSTPSRAPRPRTYADRSFLLPGMEKPQ